MRITVSSKPTLRRSLMVQRPNIGRDSLNLRRRKLRASHWRHWVAILLRLRNPGLDRFRDRLQAAIAPEPAAGYEARRQRRTLGVGAVTARAGAAGGFAMENPAAKRNLLWRDPRRGGKVSRAFPACLGMDAFGRSNRIRRGSRGRCQARTRSSRPWLLRYK